MIPVDVPPSLRDYFESSPVALSLGAAEGDHPLLVTNQRFRDLTGYATTDIAGRNCRFLQGNSDNREARARIRAFLRDDAQPSVRTAIVNFRKDGKPFVNLLYLSKLRSLDGAVRYFFASQFDVSRTQPERLADYDAALGQTIARLAPVIADSGIAVEGTLITIANTAATIAQAKMTLADLDTSGFL
jgi:PAS domain S-box-containing protein